MRTRGVCPKAPPLPLAPKGKDSEALQPVEMGEDTGQELRRWPPRRGRTTLGRRAAGVGPVWLD